MPFYESNEDTRGFQADSWAQGAQGRVADQWAASAVADAPDRAAAAEQAAQQAAQQQAAAQAAAQAQAQAEAQRQAEEQARQQAEAAAQAAQQRQAAADQWAGQAHQQAASVASTATDASSLAPSQMPQQATIDSSSPEAFIRSITPWAQQISQQTGIPAAAMIGMAANETGYGKFAAGNNLFGIKGSGPAGSINSQTWEDYGSGPVTIRSNFRAYANPGESFQDFADLVTNAPRYAAAKGQTTVEGFVQALKDGGYMTDPAYVGKISSIVQRFGGVINDALQGAGQAVGGAVQGAGQAAQDAGAGAARVVQGAVNTVIENLRPSQFAVGLDSASAYAACGPVAAIAFARAIGRNPTAQEAVQLAKQVGWTAAQGMAGPGSELSLLTSMGVPAHMENGADVSKMATDVGNGNPVIISTPGHYFVADGYDPQSGAFHVGTSGTDLRRGSEWMTLGQMQNVMGNVQATLFLDRQPGDGPSIAAQARGQQPGAPGAPGGQPVQPRAQTMADFINQRVQSGQGMPTDTELGNFILSQPPEQTAASVGQPQPIQQPSSPFDVVGNIASGLGGAVSGAVSGVGSALGGLFGRGGPGGQPPPGPTETAPVAATSSFPGLPQLPTGMPSEGGGYGAGGPLLPGEAASAFAPVGQAATDLASSPLLPTNLTNAGLQAVGQNVVAPGLEAIAQPGGLLAGPRAAVAGGLEGLAGQMPAGMPVVAGALRGAAGMVGAPTILESAQTVSDLEQKYGGGIGTDGKFRAADYRNITPEDQEALHNAIMAVGGVTVPPTPEGGIPGELPRSLPESLGTRTRNDIYETQREGGYRPGVTWVVDPDGTIREKAPNERLIDRRDPGADTPYFAVQRRGGPVAYVGEMYVPEDMRGQGLGQRMYQHMAEWAVSEGRTLISGSDRSASAEQALRAAERKGMVTVVPNGEVDAILPGPTVPRSTGAGGESPIQPTTSLDRFGLTDRPTQGQAPLSDDELLSHYQGLEQQYEANNVQIARLADQLHEARNPGVAPIRPQWAVGLPNESVIKIANDHGVSPYREDWWEQAGLSQGSQEVSRLLSEGGYRGVGTRRLGGSQLQNAQAELDRLRAENQAITDHLDPLTAAEPGTLYRAPAMPAELPFAPPTDVVQSASREPATPAGAPAISPPTPVGGSEAIAATTPADLGVREGAPRVGAETPAAAPVSGTAGGNLPVEQMPEFQAAAVGGGVGEPPIRPPTAVGAPSPLEPEPGLLTRLTQGQPEQAGNITLSKYPEDVRQIISDAASSLPEQMKASTRGVLPDQAVRDLSQQTGMDVDQIVRNWNPGQAQNAETLLALRDALTAQARKVIDAQQTLRTTPDSAAARSDLLEALTQHAAIQEVVSGSTAEAGRALRQFRQAAPGSDFATNQISQMAARSGMTPEEMVDALGRVNLSDPAAVAQLSRSLPQGPPTLAEIFKTYHTNNVISGLPTLTHVAVNSILAPAWSFSTRSLADLAGLNFDRVQGGGIGFGAGLAHAGEDFLTGFSDVFNNPASVANRLGGPGGAALKAQGVFGALHGAFQNVAQGIIERTEIGRLAGEAATDQGLKGVAWTKYVADALDNPAADMLQQARGVAERAALRGQLGTFGQKMQQIANVPFIGNTLFPVVKISTNALTQGIERSPLGLLGTGFDVARAARGVGPYAKGFEPVAGAVTPLSERLTNNLAGTAVAALLVNKALDGTITGDGPSDPKERAALMSQGWQANSLYVPGRGYVDYRVLGPLAQDFALAGNYADAVLEVQKHPGQATLGQDALEVAGNLAQRQASYMSDATGLRTLGQIYEVLHGGAKAANVAAQFFGQMAGGFVPESAAVRGLVSAADPYARQSQRGDIGEVIAQGLPGGTPGIGGRTDLPVRLNEMGQPETNPQVGLGIFVPRTGTGTVSPVMTLLGSVGLSPPSAPNSVRVGQREITLSTDEQRQYQQLRGALLEQMMTPLTQNQQFSQAPDTARKVVLQRLVDQADQVAQRQLIGTIAQSGDFVSRLGPGPRQQEPVPFRPPIPLTELTPATSAATSNRAATLPLTSDMATLDPLQQEQIRRQLAGTP